MSLYAHPKNRTTRDFYRKNYGNPMFGRGHRRKTWLTAVSAKKMLLASVATLLAGGTVWFFFWSPVFSVKSVEIAGASAATEQALRSILEKKMDSRLLGILPRSDVFLFNTEDAAAEIGRTFFFDDLKLRKKLPGTLTLTVKEKNVVAVLADGSRFLGLDSRGYVVRDLTDREIRDIADLPPDLTGIAAPSLGAMVVDVPPAVAQPETPKKNDNPLPLAVDDGKSAAGTPPAPRHPGEQVFSPSTMTLVLTAYGLLPDIAGPVKWLRIDEAGESVTAAMAGDWNVYLTTALPFDIQGSRLGLILKDKIGAQKGQLDYVDLRYNEKIFYHLKEPSKPPDLGKPAQ